MYKSLPEMQYIPPFLSQIIDAVAFDGDPNEFQDEWRNWKTDFQQYFERESDYSVSKEDAGIVENIPPLLSQLENAVLRAFEGQRKVDELIQYAVDFFQAHDSFFEEREKQYFVQNPSLDRFLKASVAYLQDQADSDAVLRRAPDAVLAVDALHDLYQQVREELPKELITGTVDGFQRAQKGFELLAEHDRDVPEKVVEEAIFEIRSAGELLEHIPHLFRTFEEEKGSPVPVLGPLLHTLREHDDESQLKLLKEQAWPAFLEMWEGRQDGWLLDPDVAYDILTEAEVVIEQLSELVEIYPEEEEVFWETVDRLEDTFFLIRENSMNLEALPSSPFWPEAKLMLNLLRGGAPLYAAQIMAAGISESEEEAPDVIQTVGHSLTNFVQAPQPLPLLRALKALKEELELSESTRMCSSCGHRMPLEATQCPTCGVNIEELSISG